MLPVEFAEKYRDVEFKYRDRLLPTLAGTGEVARDIQGLHEAKITTLLQSYRVRLEHVRDRLDLPIIAAEIKAMVQALEEAHTTMVRLWDVSYDSDGSNYLIFELPEEERVAGVIRAPRRWAWKPDLDVIEDSSDD